MCGLFVDMFAVYVLMSTLAVNVCAGLLVVHVQRNRLDANLYAGVLVLSECRYVLVLYMW